MEQAILNLLNMFGTGKDVNTGKTYFTFLGQEGSKAVDNIKAVIAEMEKFKNISGQSVSKNESLGVLGSFLLS